MWRAIRSSPTRILRSQFYPLMAPLDVALFESLGSSSVLGVGPPCTRPPWPNVNANNSPAQYAFTGEKRAERILLAPWSPYTIGHAARRSRTTDGSVGNA